MTRDEFIETLIPKLKSHTYTIADGVLTIQRINHTPDVRHILKCWCGEDCCEGWALVREGGVNWHKFANGLTDMTGEEAMAADALWRSTHRP